MVSLLRARRAGTGSFFTRVWGYFSRAREYMRSRAASGCATALFMGNGELKRERG